MTARTLALAALLVALLATPARAADYTVDTGHDLGNGVCLDGECTLRDALAQAGPSDRVILPPGTYELEEAQLQFDGDTLVGADSRETIIVGAFNQRVIYIASGTNAISKVTIQGGDGGGAPSTRMGGGILVGVGAGLTVVDSTLRQNESGQGGAIANRGTLAVVRSTVTDNLAAAATAGAQGGGIYSQGTTTLRNSTVSGNRAMNAEAPTSEGGGIYVASGTLSAESTTIAGNLADDGGAIVRSGFAGTLTLTRSIVSSDGVDVCRGGPYAGGLNIVDHITCGANPAEPLLGALGNNGGPTDTHQPLVDSPALDAGGDGCPVDDQRGFARPAQAACDVGSVEVGAVEIVADLRVITQVVNNSGGTATPASFSVHVRRDGIDVGGSPAPGNPQGRDYTGLAVGDYVVAGAAANGYTSQTGGDCAAGGAITIRPGDEPSCVVTFDDVAPSPPSGGGGPQPPPPPGDDEQELPPPKAGEEVNVLPSSGTVRVKVRGSNRFVELEEGRQIPVGSVIDTTKGRVTIVAAGDQQADFYGGIFRLGQGKGTKPLTTLTLVEKLSCPKAGSAVAAAKKKKRRLWGDGSGRFRTKGKHSAATVVGTKWLVEDRCTSTLTRVVRGRVSVRDFAKKKTVTVRAGKKYVARAKKK